MPKSREVGTGMALLVLFSMLAFVGTWVLAGFIATMRRSLTTAGETEGLDPAQGWLVMMETGSTVIRLVAPFAVAGLVGALIAAGIQIKPGLYLEVLKPRPSAINPKNGVKKLFSPRSLVTVAKDLVKLAAVGGIAFAILKGAIPELTQLMGAGPGPLLVVTAKLVMRLGFAFVAIYLLIAVVDLLYERWQHERDIRMTKQEVKREGKDADVSPEVKGQLKKRQHEMAVRRMMSAVPDADVVITNPTHFAVALRYTRNLPAPRVVAKGADLVAHRIIGVAHEHDVAVIQDPPLARGLYDAAEVGQYIPPEAFGAVAEILAHVYRIAGREPAAA